MDLESYCAIAFIVFLIIFLLIKRKNVQIQKIIFPFLYMVLYRTKIGLRFMDRFAKKFPRFLRVVGYISIGVGFFGMVFICYMLVQNVYSMFVKPQAVPGVSLVLPIELKGVFYVPFFYWIISIFVIALIHEFSHGIMMRLCKLRIKASGFAFLSVLIPLITLAFVEPDEKKVAKKSAKQQLMIYSAGPFANIIFGFVFLAILLFAMAPAVNSFVEYNGIKVTDLNMTAPAGIAGMKEGEIIKSVDNVELKSVINFTEMFAAKKPGEKVVIKTENNSYTVTLGKHQKNESKCYLGISVQQSTKVKDNLKEAGFFIGMFIWLAGLIYWLYLLNLGIGLFNLVPISIIDGGRMVQAVLQKYFKQEKANRIFGFISGFFFLVIIVIILRSFTG